MIARCSRRLLAVALTGIACSSATPPPATPVADESIAPAATSAHGPAAPSEAVGTEASPQGQQLLADSKDAQPLPVAPEIQQLVDAPDRDPADRELDAGRHPAELLTFIGVKPNMRIAEIGSGTGYTAELLARAAGPKGTVYAVNSPFILERFAEQPWSQRLKKPAMKNVVRVDREFSDPLPPQAKRLDIVLNVLFYHDLYWMKVDRAKMNRAIFAALKPGGVYVIVDHNARPGDGETQVQTLHRIERALVEQEVQEAGFNFVGEADFLRNPNDMRDWNASPRSAAERRGTSDRFVLKFAKP